MIVKFVLNQNLSYFHNSKYFRHVSIKNLSTVLAIYGPINWTILAMFGPRNKLEPFWQFMEPDIANFWHFMVPETAPFWWYLLGSEIAKLVQFLGPETARIWLFIGDFCWGHKSPKWCSLWGQKVLTYGYFWNFSWNICFSFQPCLRQYIKVL